MKAKQHHPLIVGTFILTATGFISRLIGFFYRIYLSRLFGEEEMGIYQLLSPILSLSFSLTAAGIQTAISKLVAEQTAIQKKASFRPVLLGLSLSLPLSLVCNAVIYFSADFIAVNLLHEIRTASMLRILSFSVPLSAVHACMNGYFYGIKKAGIPAGSQLLEQIVRVGSVYIISAYNLSMGRTPTIGVAILGLTIGEFFSMLMAVLAIYPWHSIWTGSQGRTRQAPSRNSYENVPMRKGVRTAQILQKCPSGQESSHVLYGKLLAMALPLTANRIILNLLQSMESVSIPSQLMRYGYDSTTALSVYGVLTGMAMPFIFFPNALTNSVAVLLLPMISESYALGDIKSVKKAALRTVKYCGFMGICCMGIFVFLGRWMGTTLFHSPLAGYFITTLGFLCPFLYLDTTLSSILQGLGMAGHIFVMNVFSLLLRLGFVFLAIPRFGITGYLWGILAGQLALGLLYLGCLHRFLKKH